MYIYIKDRRSEGADQNVDESNLPIHERRARVRKMYYDFATATLASESMHAEVGNYLLASTFRQVSCMTAAAATAVTCCHMWIAASFRVTRTIANCVCVPSSVFRQW